MVLTLFFARTLAILFVIGPCGILIWTSYSSLGEILISIGMGVSTTLLYTTLVRFVWREHVKFLLLIRPFTWLNLIDTYILSDDDSQDMVRIETVLKNIQKEENVFI